MAKKASSKTARGSKKTGSPAASPKQPKKDAFQDMKLKKNEADQVIIRCYRQGLGDCYLLAFRGEDKQPRYVLIDCGVHRRQDEGTARLMQVMKNITKVTQRLDVVVATHEHADHLSGFVQKNSPFLKNSLKIGEVWLAWTEDPEDSEAKKLRKKRGVAREILQKAVERIQSQAESDVALSDLKNTLESTQSFEEIAKDAYDERQVMNFLKAQAKSAPQKASIYSEYSYRRSVEGPGELGAANTNKKNKPSSNELALSVLTMKGEPKYFRPGETAAISGVDHVQAYVLGPPRKDQKLLKKDRASKVRGKEEYKETYLSSYSAVEAFRRSPALKVDQDDSEYGKDTELPFAFRYRKSREQRFNNDLYRRYQKEEDKWRQIDNKWLHSAEQLALNLDNDTNNTSLVLAFELGTPGKGPVLLFPGDAQVGNWLSWRDQEYKHEKTASTADDLMSRTRFYKAGHHASHNATIKRDPREITESHPLGVPFGLELMRDIIVSIPVDRAAVDKAMPTPWAMPHEPLYKVLREKAKRRVLRSDCELAPLKESEDDKDLVPEKTDWAPIPGMKDAKWRKSSELFEAGKQEPLFYDVKIPIR